MKISVTAYHRYPAKAGGPSGGRVFDVLVKGLAELGHEVSYHVAGGVDSPMPPGVRPTDSPCFDADILHCRSDDTIFRAADERSLPWVATCHTDLATWNKSRSVATDNWIFVSKTLAETYGRRRFVLNGIDPDELEYSTVKEDYVLFVAIARLAERKGLPQAIALCRRMGLRLIVAGGGPDEGTVARIATLCRVPGVEYVGEISGNVKAKWFAGARAFLFPTQLNEAFGLVMAEALMSGTPVVCSGNGACPEVISDDTGFVCSSDEDYLDALGRVHEIDPQVCRETALHRFHYLRMARDYVEQYKLQRSLTTS